MQKNGPQKGKMAYDNIVNGMDNIQDIPEQQKKASEKGNGLFNRMESKINKNRDAGYQMPILTTFFHFLIRYIVFVFLGMYLSFRFYDKSHFSFANLFAVIVAGATISYIFYCTYIYFIRTPLMINKRLGIPNKFYEYSFHLIEIVLPSLAVAGIMFYMKPSFINKITALFALTIALTIGLFIFFYLKLKKEINLDTDEHIPLLALWVYKLSKKNNSNFKPSKENTKIKP